MTFKSRFAKRSLSVLITATFILSGIPAFPQIAEAATVVFTDDFGTGADSATLTGWEKHEAATIAREGQVSGEDIASPNGGRFAKIAEDGPDGNPHDGYICREIDAEDFTSLTLSYYWNGDFDAEASGGGGPDLGIVEARNNGNGDGTCGAQGGWDVLQSHDLTQHSSSWNEQTAFDISEYDESKFLIRFRNESSADDEWFRVDGIEILGESTDVEEPEFPTVSTCELTGSVITTDLSTWDLSETRATGHNEIITDGLHIWTEGNTSTDKAAGYYTTNFPLYDLGDQTIADALDYEADFGIEPGLQLVVDFDNDGSIDGILVGESVYGNNWWLTNSSAQFVKDDAPNTGGGNGSNWFGTPDEWLSEFPDAQVKAIGYSLGSGVHGDGVIKSINLGCIEYTFSSHVEPTPTTTVEICKFNDDEEPLENWTLMLLGEEVEDVVVPANTVAGVNTSASLIAGKSYFAIASGVWLNDREPDNHVDAEYSTEDNWITYMDGFTGYGNDILDLQIDESFVYWGPYNDDHTYATSFTPGVDGSINFRIFDGTGSTPNPSWYGDNSGSLEVSIYEGYAGVTGENGCVTFEEVPHGGYEIDEILQDGWTNVSGLGEVIVDAENNSFTVVNTDGPKQCVDQLEGDWADNVEEFDQGKRKNGTDVLLARSDETDALGEADWASGLSTGFVSLGFGGSIVVSFDSFVPNVDGNDISIHEATNGIYPAETALIEVSQNGSDWHAVGTATSTGVTYFDFDSTGLAWIKYVRITDTTNPAIHANDADGFDLDAVDAIQTVCIEPVPPQMCSVTIVSDETNEVEETEGFAKILSFVHTAWTAVIADAEWIWGHNPVANSAIEETQTFTKSFEWSGGIASAILDIASDNHYTVYLNDIEVASSTDDNNFQIGTQDQINLSAYVVAGENELKIEVVNLAGSSNPQSNPAGLLYNLTVTSTETGEGCMFAPEEPDSGLEITKPETEDQVLSGTYTFEAEYVDADNDPDPVQWAIRAGTCNAGTNTVAGNVDGFNTPFFWNGASFSSTIDMDDWDEGKYCFVVNPTEDSGSNFRETRWFILEHPEPTQCLVVSDTHTIVVENNDYAVATWDLHHNWTHDITDAIWIWDSFYVENPEDTETRTFKETFIVTDIDDATFEIAADNTYTVYINGVQRYQKLNANNYQTPDVYTDVADFLVEGENELVVEITNIGTDGSIPKTNPAGTLFKLTMDVDGECEITTAPEDDSEPIDTDPTVYEVFGFAWDDDNENTVKDGGEDFLAGVSVSISNGTTTIATSTDAGGRYYFMVEPDTWTISAALTDWDLTYPATSGNTHEVIVTATTSGPHDFGLDEDEGGGIITGGFAPFSGGGGIVAGTSTTFDGRGGGIDLWEELQNQIQNSAGPLGSVLGATAEAQENTEDATTTPESAETDSNDAESAALAAMPWTDWLCDYLWLLPLLWIIASAIAYWRKESYDDPKAMFWTQLVFGTIALIFILGYMVVGVPCAWLPSAIVAIGSAVMTYYGKE